MYYINANEKELPVSVTQTDKPSSSPQLHSYCLGHPGLERKQLLTHTTKFS